jgi:hypothetical protein
MTKIKLFRTKAGKGYKVVVGDDWFFTSRVELHRLVMGVSNSCSFRPINVKETAQPEIQVDGLIENEKQEETAEPLIQAQQTNAPSKGAKKDTPEDPFFSTEDVIMTLNPQLWQNKLPKLFFSGIPSAYYSFVS